MIERHKRPKLDVSIIDNSVAKVQKNHQKPNNNLDMIITHSRETTSDAMPNDWVMLLY